MRKLAPVVILVPWLFSCTTVQQMSDDELSSNIRLGAEAAVSNGLRYAMQRLPDKAAEIAKDAGLADEVIAKNVLPVFAGAETQEVLRSAVDAALELLSSKLSPTVISSVQLAINLVAANVKLPANPADKLDERTRKALAGLFSGISAGIKTALATPVAISPAPKLSWPK